MDIGAVFLILTVALLAGLFISRPFLAAQPARSPARPSRLAQDESLRSRLLAEYERYLTALQELDFDQALGKIPEGDYPQQRQAYLQAAADLLRSLDADFGAPPPHKIAPSQPVETQNLAFPSPIARPAETQNIASPNVRPAETQNIASPSPIARPAETQNIASLHDATPEDRIEAAIAARRATAPSSPPDDLETMIAARRRARQEKSNGFCPSCGKPVQKSDRFCPKCGKAL